MTVRKAVTADIPAIMTVLEAARGIMRASGNPFQWPAGYPTREMIEADLEAGVGRVFEADGSVMGYFACIPGPDPTYSYIEDGAWIEDSTPYYVIHRIASLPSAHGIFKGIIDYTSALSRNIRIDTHKDNKIMQGLLARHGFSYCGIIYLKNGSPRLAYQRVR